jgi:hypothetical protein
MEGSELPNFVLGWLYFFFLMLMLILICYERKTLFHSWLILANTTYVSSSEAHICRTRKRKRRWIWPAGMMHGPNKRTSRHLVCIAEPVNSIYFGAEASLVSVEDGDDHIAQNFIRMITNFIRTVSREKWRRYLASCFFIWSIYSLITFIFLVSGLANYYLLGDGLSAIEKYFSLTTNQFQQTYQPQKP